MTRETSEVSLPVARIAVIIPALNEEQALPHVLKAIPVSLQAHVIVVDNGSTDATPDVARQNGAQVVFASERGYGAAREPGTGGGGRLRER